MIIEINKDIESYQESVVMGLSAKQLIFSIASVIVGGGLILLLYPIVGLTASAYIAIPIIAPIALGGFYTFNGMNFYEYIKRKIHYAFFNRPYTYVSTEGEMEIVQYKQSLAMKEKQKKKQKKGGKKRGIIQ